MSKVEELAEKIGGMDKKAAGMLGDALMRALGLRVYQAPQPPKRVEAEVVVQTEFTVKLVGFAVDKKIALIREIRVLTGLGLAESKGFVESSLISPQIVREGLSKHVTQELQQKLEGAGAVVQIV